ncbi:hypothetical protein LXA43DRAFT_1057645 [Ganoderma leucocontextum]|nr:hypothetical protein LXA43DRAFT_1057645 [Ganoderma leucocontextum]
MPRTPSKKKDKTSSSPRAAAAKRKGARGNQALFFSPLPPTPSRKTKRRRVVESDDEVEPVTKKNKPSKEPVAHSGDPDRRKAKHGSQNGNPLPSPRPSSPPPAPPPPEPRPSSQRDPSPRPLSGQRDSTHRDPTRLDAAQHDSTQPNPARRDAGQGQSNASSGRSTSNAAASRPVPCSPGRTFAESLKAMKEFDLEGEELDDLELQEDNVKTRKRKSKGKKVVAEEDEDDDDDDKDDKDEADEDEDDDEDDKDDFSNNDEDELSTEAVDHLMTLIRSRKKQKYSLIKKQSNPERLPGHFKKWGRHAHCLLGVYTNVHKTITTGMMVLKSHPSTTEEYTRSYRAIPNMSPATAKFYTKKFMYLCDVVPKLKALCGHLLYRTGDMFVFAKFFKKHAGAGRSSDISTLKRNFAAYLPRVTLSDNVVICPLTQVEYANKTRNGGYFSVSTGRLVLPIHERDTFDEDPVEYNKQKANQHKSFVHQNKCHKADRTTDDDKSYPGFLFPSRFDYDERAPQRGMFKNGLCESVLRHWLKGPSAVGLSDGAPNLGRTCLADIYDITKLMPDYLAYAATLIRHLLSVDGRWSGDDKRRSGHRFHTSPHRLLTLDYEMWEEDVESGELHDGEGTHWMMENIFSYYNRLLFGAEEGNPEEQAAERSEYGDDDSDDYDNLRARALKAHKAELEDMRRLRLERNRKQQDASSQEPQQLRAQSVDYVNAEPLADRALPGMPGGAEAEADDDA